MRAECARLTRWRAAAYAVRVVRSPPVSFFARAFARAPAAQLSGCCTFRGFPGSSSCPREGPVWLWLLVLIRSGHALMSAPARSCVRHVKYAVWVPLPLGRRPSSLPLSPFCCPPDGTFPSTMHARAMSVPHPLHLRAPFGACGASPIAPVWRCLARLLAPPRCLPRSFGCCVPTSFFFSVWGLPEGRH